MKSKVYSWRLSSRRKTDLEAEARHEGASLAELLEEITEEWLATRRGARRGEKAEQERVRARAATAFGTISGGNRDRSTQVRQTVRTRLKQRHAAQRAR